MISGRRLAGAWVAAMLCAFALHGAAQSSGEAELLSANQTDKTAPFSLRAYRYQSRLLVLGAPSLQDATLLKQLAAVEASREEFLARDLVTVVVVEGAGSHADGRTLTGDDAARLRARLRLADGSFALRLVGKDGGVKLSAGEWTAMTSIYALIDTMPMRRAEMRDRQGAVSDK